MSFWKIFGGTYNFFVLPVFSIEDFESAAMRNSKTNQIRQYNHNQNLLYQESNASIHMVDERAVILLQRDSRNEPGLYPLLNNQSKFLVLKNRIRTTSSPTITYSTNNNYNTVTPI